MVRGISWSDELETVFPQDAAEAEDAEANNSEDNHQGMQGAQDSVSLHLSDASLFADLGRNNPNNNENNAGGEGMLGSFLE